MDDAQKLSMATMQACTDPSQLSEVEQLMEHVYLPQAKAVVHHWRNPFSPDADWEEWLDTYQVRVAVDMFARRGAEGEVSHTENGIDRTWEWEDTPYGILKQVPRRGKFIKVSA